MNRPAIRIEGLSKLYRLGQTHDRSIAATFSRTVARITGKREPQFNSAERDFWALRDINLEVPEGETLGIIGGNGAGKSTLLKVLSRITQPTSGRALVRGRLSSLLEVGTGFHPELSGRENVFLNGTILGMRRAEVARKFDEIVAFAGIEQFIDTPVKRYSSGMYVRLAFAVAAHLEPDVLIVDEVLAVGDVGFQKRCLGKMGDVARQGRTVLFVSHNMAAVQKLCSRVVWLQSGQMREVGAPDQVVAHYLEAFSDTLADAAEQTPGFLYRNPDRASDGPRILSVQMLSERGEPLMAARTWDRARFRISFHADRAYRSFSAVLNIATPDGVSVLLTSTTPDQTLPFSVQPGSHTIDCEFEQFPLTAGEYVLGAGLAIPGVEYVARNDALCRLNVQPKDVFGSALPPSANRYLVATPHAWSLPQPSAALGRAEA